ncbi:MAG TPA: AbrB/MazE/SpoVT family DNA-binding domain-containing protein [Ktedonobacteraceae bacterium]|nr:AbrB/MazE/SpoVT family DNA-binding domain-containing protein [Ktedonobacteraceae bacterium]
MELIWTKIAEDGSVVIPAEYLQALGVQVGNEVILELDGKELRICTLQQAIKRIQELVSQYVSPERSLADELIAERRRESWSED